VKADRNAAHVKSLVLLSMLLYSTILVCAPAVVVWSFFGEEVALTTLYVCLSVAVLAWVKYLFGDLGQ
jgi:hypothetical protein